jgi:hypothetical protein
MSRETWIWDRVACELVTRDEMDLRREARKAFAPRAASIKIPRVKRGRWVFRGGKLVEISAVERKGGPSLQIIRDVDPYKSIVTGEVVGGRRQHREHLKRTGCVELGNDMPRAKPVEPGAVAPDLRRALETGMTPEVRHAVERAKHARMGE